MPTSSNPKRDKQHSNYEFIYHPKKRLNQKKLNLKDKSYLEKKVIIDDKNNFSNKSKSWFLNKKDYVEIMKILKQKK